MRKKMLYFGFGILIVLTLLGCNKNENNTPDIVPPSPSEEEPETPFYDIPTEEEPELNIYYHGFEDLNRYSNKDNLKSFYIDIKHGCENFDYLKEDASKEELTINGKTDTYFVVCRINYEKYNLSTSQALAVWKVFGLDHPEYYWISTTVVNSTFDGNEALALMTDCEYALYEDRKKIQESLDEFVSNLNILISRTDSYSSKVELIHDYICEYAQYAYDENGLSETDLWAHNITGIPMYGKSVCEGYTKMFTYLCQLNEVKAISVTGTRKNNDKMEPHAWNLVQIDNKWYAVDTTWDDSLNTKIYFCCGYSTISVNHIADVSDSLADGIDYIYNLPKIELN